MNSRDYIVLFVSILAIAVYGIIRTRGRRNLHDYLRGKQQSWFAIGLSVMATQASAITFLSTPGQGYENGMAFVQNYFAVPLALVIIAAFFLPIYRKLNVYTAYEYLGRRFDTKTRLLAAAIFLIARGFGAGITIYAPAIVLSTVFGWSLPLTIIGAGLVVTGYTVAGGSDAVTHTQKYQVAIIFAGMIAAFIILLQKIPCSFSDALTLAGHFHKTTTVDLSLDPKKDYTLWTGMFGGIFLMLSYFGTDQSQVQRYISGDNLRESRLGLMFNALLKIPMQFGILLLGVMLFIFYQFTPGPIFFNQNIWNTHAKVVEERGIEWLRAPWDKTTPQPRYSPTKLWEASEAATRAALSKWHEARISGDAKSEAESIFRIEALEDDRIVMKSLVKDELVRVDPHLSTKDSDYVFITFILDNLPHGLIGLLVAAFFSAALSSKASELNALASTSVIDFYRPYFLRQRGMGGVPPISPSSTVSTPTNTPSLPPEHRRDAHAIPSDRHLVLASKAFTTFWGLFAIAFALFAHMSRNLIEASNILGSIFSGVVLGLFLIAFFLKHVRGTAAFTAALLAQSLVISVYALIFFKLITLPYLWLNAIGALACITLALIIQSLLRPKKPQGFPVLMEANQK